MFTIADGRDHFFQWDLNRQIIVSDPTIDEVHFCNKTDDCSLVLEVEEEVLAERLDGTKIIRRYVNVPNILLQDALPIRVYAFCVDYTKVEKIFKVCPRTRPADYIYEETEIKRWEDTVNKADETLDRANEVLDGASDILIQAQEAADNASTSASNALESAANANESETNAATSASNASKSATDALSNANKSKASELNAQAAALDAVSAKESTEQLKTDVTNLKSDTESLKNTTQGFANDAEASAQVATTKANEASESATSAANTVEGFNEYVEGHKLEFTHDGNGAVTLEGVELNGLDNYYTKEETYNKTEIDALIPSVPFYHVIWFNTGFSGLTDEDKNIIKHIFINDDYELEARNIYFGWSGARYNIARIERSTDYMNWYSSINAKTGIEMRVFFSFDDNDDLKSCSLSEIKLEDTFATTKYVDNAIENIPAPDLSEYALKTELPSTEGLATEEYVDTAISNIPIPSGGLEMVTIFEGPESPTAGREYTTTENIKYYVVLCGDTSLASGAAWTHFVPANSTDIRFITDPSTQVAIKYNGSPNSLKIVSGSRIKIHYVFGFK